MSDALQGHSPKAHQVNIVQNMNTMALVKPRKHINIRPINCGYPRSVQIAVCFTQDDIHVCKLHNSFTSS
jgi:hypothetical protein